YLFFVYLFHNPFSSTTIGDENPIRTLRDYSKPSHEGYRNTIELLIGKNVVPLRSDTIRLVQNGCSFHKIRSENPNQHLKDFLKLVDSLDLDGENRERTRLRLFQFSLRDQASNWLELFLRIYHHMGGYYSDYCSISSKTSWRSLVRDGLFQGLTPKCPSSWHRPLASSQFFMTMFNLVTRQPLNYSAVVKRPKKRSRLHRSLPPRCLLVFTQLRSDILLNPHPLAQSKRSQIHPKQPEESQVNEPDIGQEEKGNLGNINSNPHPQPDPLASIATKQVRNLNSMLESLGLVPQSSNTKFVDGEVMFIEIIRDDDEPQNKGPDEGERATTEGPAVEYFDTFPTRDETNYNKFISRVGPSFNFLRNPIIIAVCPIEPQDAMNIGHMCMWKASLY
ncbi:hypothetical protein Tco_1196850, partial [Tanacetum coccineum]